MVEYPFQVGETVTLDLQYKIMMLSEETQNFVIYDVMQLSTQKKVQMKVFLNDSFSSALVAENVWRSEVMLLQTQTEEQETKIKYIESAAIMLKDQKLFVIVYSDIDSLIHAAESEMVDLQRKEEEKQSIPKPLEKTPGTPTMVSEGPVETPPSPKTPSTPVDDVLETTTPVKELVKDFEAEPEPAIPEKAEEFEFAEELEAEPEKLTEEAIAPESPPTSGLPKRDKKKAARTKPTPAVDEDYGAELRSTTAPEEVDYLKHILLDYFDRMNPQNYYPMHIVISDVLQDMVAPVVNPLTGERKVQKKTEMEVTLKDPIVTIQPVIPGCNVVPSEIKTDFSLEKDKVTFFITPGVKGEIVGHIKFFNEDQIIHIYDFEAKVVDPRIARLVAVYTILASFIPKALTLFGVDFGLEDLLTPEAFPYSVTGLIALAGIIPAILLGVGVRQRMKPKSCKVFFKLKDFRLKSLKPHTGKQPTPG
jgi:hypothetical protein